MVSWSYAHSLEFYLRFCSWLICKWNTYNLLYIFSVPIEGKDLISGGEFGFEASIVETILELAISLFVIYLIKKEKKGENYE